MELQIVHLLVAKFGVVIFLGLLMTGCSIKVEDEALNSEDAGSTNRLIAITEGAYSLQLNSNEVTCRGLLDFKVKELEYSHRGEPGDPDEGLKIQLSVAGDFEKGEALTADNSGADRYFDFRMVTPDGTAYQYDSSRSSEDRPTFAALTVLKASDFLFKARLWIEQLAPMGGGERQPASFRGTFDCGQWETRP